MEIDWVGRHDTGRGARCRGRPPHPLGDSLRRRKTKIADGRHEAAGLLLQAPGGGRGLFDPGGVLPRDGIHRIHRLRGLFDADGLLAAG
jgi:hypothetical protein